MSPKPTILVVGSINMDLVVRTPRMPEPGETVLGSGFKTRRWRQPGWAATAA